MIRTGLDIWQNAACMVWFFERKWAKVALKLEVAANKGKEVFMILTKMVVDSD